MQCIVLCCQFNTRTRSNTRSFFQRVLESPNLALVSPLISSSGAIYAISRTRIEYKDQYGEPIHPNVNTVFSKCWHDLDPRSGGWDALQQAESVAVSFLWLHPIWALPANIAAGGNAVFPPMDLGSRDSRVCEVLSTLCVLRHEKRRRSCSTNKGISSLAGLSVATSSSKV